LCQLLQHCCAIVSVIAALLCHCVSYCSTVVPLCQLLQHCFAIVSVIAALLCHCVSYCSTVVPLTLIECKLDTDRRTGGTEISKERHEMCQGDQEGALKLHDEERRKERQSHRRTDGRELHHSCALSVCGAR